MRTNLNLKPGGMAMLLRRNRALFLSVAVCCLLAALLPVVFLALGAPHDCAGENCAVCALLRQAARLTFGAGRSLPQGPAALLPTFLFLLFAAGFRLHRGRFALFSVRLNN